MKAETKMTSHISSGHADLASQQLPHCQSYEHQQAIKAQSFRPTEKCEELPIDDVEKSIPERFEKIVRRYPNRLAVKMGNRGLTYNDLNQAANRVARAIRAKRGEGSEPIALLFEHGIDSIVAIFGVLKAGKFYVALDPSVPRDRIRYILEDTKPPLIVTNERNSTLAQQLTNGDAMSLNVDEIDDSLCCENLGLLLTAQELSTVIYTSGSTGEPKGVAETHEFRLAETKNHIKIARLCPEDRLALLHSVSFSSANVQLFSSLLNGASIWPFDLKNEGVGHFAEWLLDNRITVLHLPPSAFRQLSELITNPTRFARIRMIRLSGAPITIHDFNLYRSNWPRQTSLLIAMGSTEFGTIAQAILDKRFQFPYQGTPIGYPAPYKKILLLDANGQEVGPGQTGELAVKGRCLTAGYWTTLKQITTKVLTHSNNDKERTYLNGDIARMLPDGFLIHMGRKDFMVKIRGYRVEIGEIERALLLHPKVKEAGVAALNREAGEKYLVAYIVPRQMPAPTTSEFFSFLKETLPDYMIPSTFVFLDSLPLTNGKLNRAALPLPDHGRPQLSKSYIAPRNLVEEKLVQIWEKVLDLRPIGIHDDFFDLGGHSLLASRLFVEIEKAFGKQLPLTTLFWARNVEQLARIIQNEDWSAPWSLLFPVQPGGSKPPFFWVYGETSDVLLPRYLGPDQPLYGLMHEARTGNPVRYTKLTDIAANHLKDIQTVQPRGPYFLGGFCFGGMVAFEMAQQLQKQGQEVALLFLVDLGTLNNWRSRYEKTVSFRHEVSRHSRNLARISVREKLKYVQVRVEDRIRGIISRGKNIALTVARNAYFVSGCPLPPLLRQHYVSTVDHWAMQHYEPEVYPDDVILFKAQGTPYDPGIVAKLTAGKLHLHELPCSHNEIIKDPQVSVWASQLKSCLHNKGVTH